jgi:hypothetical protein
MLCGKLGKNARFAEGLGRAPSRPSDRTSLPKAQSTGAHRRDATARPRQTETGFAQGSSDVRNLSEPRLRIGPHGNDRRDRERFGAGKITKPRRKRGLRFKIMFVRSCSSKQPTSCHSVQTLAVRSITIARPDNGIFARGILIIAVATPPIIAMPALGFRADERARRSTHQRARDGATCAAGHSSADQAPEDGATDGTSDCFLGRRGRGRWWRIPTFDRRRIGSRAIRRFDRTHWDFVNGFDIRNVNRRPVHRLRIKIPGTVDVPPPAKSPIVPFVAPMSAIPSEATVINVPAKRVRWQGAVSKVSRLRTGSSPRREGDAVRARRAGLYEARPCGRIFGRWLMLRLFVRVLLLLSDRIKRCRRHH